MRSKQLLNNLQHLAVFLVLLSPVVAAAQPVINSFSPAAGPIGTIVIINGKNFSATPAKNIVYFGAVSAKIKTAATTSLTVTVPYGASYQPVSVTVDTLTGYSGLPFLVTFKGDHKINAKSFAGKVNFSGNNNGITRFAAADLDGDGKTDMAAVNPDENTVSIFQNTGHAGVVKLNYFEWLTTGKHPSSVVITDVTGDGRPDIIITEDSSHSIAVYRNMSSPGYFVFEDKIEYDAGTYITNIAATDINNDGKPDIIVSDSINQKVTAFKNTGLHNNVSFAAAQSIATGVAASSIYMQDVNTDSKPDLIIGNKTSNTVSVLANTSTAQNISFAAKKDFSISKKCVSVITGDIDGDGKADIITANADSSVSVLKNNGTGTVISFAGALNIRLNTSPNNIALNDIDGDGKLDMAISNSSKNMLVVKNTTAQGSLSFGTPVSYALNAGSKDVIATDIDNDGRPDIIAALSKSISVLRSLHIPVIKSITPVKGISGTPVTIKGYGFVTTKSVSFGDSSALSFKINSDTVITATVTYGATGQVILTTNDGADTLNGFTFIPPPVITTVTPLSGHNGIIVTIRGKNFVPSVDSNIVYFGAVKATILSATDTIVQVMVPAAASYLPISLTCNALTAYYKLPFTVTFTGAKSTFETGDFTSAGQFNTGNYPVDIAITDIDGDGKADVCTSNSAGNNFSVLLNQYDTGVSFAKKKDYGLPFSPNKIASADFNGDGKPDIAVTSSDEWESKVAIYKNQSTSGNVVLKHATDDSVGYEAYPTGIATGDLDGDGKSEIAVIESSNIIIFKNTSINGNISFAPGVHIGSVNLADGLTIGDIDGDSKADIAATDGSGYVYVYRNTGYPGNVAFAPQQRFAAGFSPGYVKLGDLDGDSLPEMVISNRGNDNISVYRNTSTQGHINFDKRINYSLSGYSPSYIFIADLDGDSKADILVSSGSSTVSAFKNTSTKGSISFQNHVDFATGGGLRYAAVNDVNGDARPDIICIEPGENSHIAVLANGIKNGFTISNAKTIHTILTVFPNPVKDKLHIEGLEKISAGIITVSNTAGAVLYKQQFKQNNVTIDVHSLPAGMYVVNIYGANSTRSLQFLKE